MEQAARHRYLLESIGRMDSTSSVAQKKKTMMQQSVSSLPHLLPTSALLALRSGPRAGYLRRPGGYERQARSEEGMASASSTAKRGAVLAALVLALGVWTAAACCSYDSCASCTHTAGYCGFQGNCTGSCVGAWCPPPPLTPTPPPTPAPTPAPSHLPSTLAPTRAPSQSPTIAYTDVYARHRGICVSAGSPDHAAGEHALPAVGAAGCEAACVSDRQCGAYQTDSGAADSCSTFNATTELPTSGSEGEPSCAALGSECAPCGGNCGQIDGCALCNQEDLADQTNCLVCLPGYTHWPCTGCPDCTGRCVASPINSTCFVRTPETPAPTASPTGAPTTSSPTGSPTAMPTASPSTSSPTRPPTAAPTLVPTMTPTAPTGAPTVVPTAPTTSPTAAPTAPTAAPTAAPSVAPTPTPTSAPSCDTSNYDGTIRAGTALLPGCVPKLAAGANCTDDNQCRGRIRNAAPMRRGTCRVRCCGPDPAPDALANCSSCDDRGACTGCRDGFRLQGGGCAAEWRSPRVSCSADAACESGFCRGRCCRSAEHATGCTDCNGAGGSCNACGPQYFLRANLCVLKLQAGENCTNDRNCLSRDCDRNGTSQRRCMPEANAGASCWRRGDDFPGNRINDNCTSVADPQYRVSDRGLFCPAEELSGLPAHCCYKAMSVPVTAQDGWDIRQPAGCLDCGTAGLCSSCRAGTFLDDGRCWPLSNVGDFCTTNATCSGLDCRGGYCCSADAAQIDGCTACGRNGECVGCDRARGLAFDRSGRCLGNGGDGAACSFDAECAGRVCAGGFCCSTTGQSESCAQCGAGLGNCRTCTNETTHYLDASAGECFSKRDSDGVCDGGGGECLSSLCINATCCDPPRDDVDTSLCRNCDCSSCAEGYFGFLGECVPQRTTGESCRADAECRSGACPRGSCCGEGCIQCTNQGCTFCDFNQFAQYDLINGQCVLRSALPTAPPNSAPTVAPSPAPSPAPSQAPSGFEITGAPPPSADDTIIAVSTAPLDTASADMPMDTETTAAGSTEDPNSPSSSSSNSNDDASQPTVVIACGTSVVVVIIGALLYVRHKKRVHEHARFKMQDEMQLGGVRTVDMTVNTIAFNNATFTGSLGPVLDERPDAPGSAAAAQNDGAVAYDSVSGRGSKPGVATHNPPRALHSDASPSYRAGGGGFPDHLYDEPGAPGGDAPVYTMPKQKNGAYVPSNASSNASNDYDMPMQANAEYDAAGFGAQKPRTVYASAGAVLPAAVHKPSNDVYNVPFMPGAPAESVYDEPNAIAVPRRVAPPQPDRDDENIYDMPLNLDDSSA